MQACRNDGQRVSQLAEVDRDAKKNTPLPVLLYVEDPLMNGFNKDVIDCSGVHQGNKCLWS